MTDGAYIFYMNIVPRKKIKSGTRILSMLMRCLKMK